MLRRNILRENGIETSRQNGLAILIYRYGENEDLGKNQEPLNKGLLIGEGNGNPLQYYCLENPVDGGPWWAAVYGVTQESDTTEAT